MQELVKVDETIAVDIVSIEEPGQLVVFRKSIVCHVVLLCPAVAASPTRILMRIVPELCDSAAVIEIRGFAAEYPVDEYCVCERKWQHDSNTHEHELE